ncbi:MAG: nitrile hydratase accessory protein [Paracoccaceae bacterium]|jgi:nitrile hydratase accessory protein
MKTETIKQPQASFEAPWHGQAFALAVALNEAGHFSWPEWTDMFSAALKQAGAQKPLDGSDDYYGIWVQTLEEMLVSKSMTAPNNLAEMKSLWRDAFLETPHGQPVIPNRNLLS